MGATVRGVRPVFKVLLGACAVLALPYLLVCGCLALGYGGLAAYDRLSGRSSAFEAAAPSASPSGDLRFAAGADGTMRILSARTGGVLHARRESTRQYRGVRSAEWPTDRAVRVTLSLRYPTTTAGRAFIWDVKTGAWYPAPGVGP